MGWLSRAMSVSLFSCNLDCVGHSEVTILENRRQAIRMRLEFWLSGRDDPIAGRFSPRRVKVSYRVGATFASRGYRRRDTIRLWPTLSGSAWTVRVCLGH
jgi:hypothetical protein